MFYSHEILTSRESGVATVWLVATLGSKSNLKKVNRKAILDVDVPRTCSIIIQPEVPMALRLQSNLLYGISRVFSQQCGYILSDAQIAQSNMRALLRAVRTSELDPNAGKARSDQLMIQDDPAFLPDLILPGLDIDLSALGISSDDSSRRSSIISPYSQRSSLSSHQEAEESMLSLVIPSSDIGGAGDLGGFILPGDNVSPGPRSEDLGRLPEEEDEDFNIDPGFTIDADGNLIEERTPGPGATHTGVVRLGSDSAASGHVRQEIMEGLQAGQFEPGAMDIDLELLRPDNDDLLLPAAEPFPAMAPQNNNGVDFLQSSSEVAEEPRLPQSAEAPSRRKRRAPKEMEADERQELHNADLAQWRTDYVQNMAEATKAKINHRAPSLAKKNARYWVIDVGIGGVGAGLGSSKFKSPLDMFAGDALMKALTGIKYSGAGRKRGRDDEEEEDNGSDSETRRVRTRDGDGDHIGRGNDLVLNDDETMIVLDSEGVEVGRHAQAPLEDPSFPWNVSASARGSQHGSIARGRGFASSIGGFPTSAGPPSSLPVSGGIGPGSLDRRASRIISASPLVGRGPERYSSLELPIREDDDELLAGRLISSDQAFDDFQLYGPAANVDTQTAAQSQWMKATLDQQASNFLDFVKAEISAIPSTADKEEDELSVDARPKGLLLFEDLLPPIKNSKIVAAQALHHILALASKSLIHVRQDSPYGPIDLAVPLGV